MAVALQTTIGKMSISERIVLAEKLWDSIPDRSNAVQLTGTQEEELLRRLDEVRAGKVKGVSWESVRAKAGKRR